MTPVTQTSFYDPDAPPDKQRGNCLTAVVASLLDLDIEQVPNFVQNHVDHDGDVNHYWNWWTRLHYFANERGFQICYVQGRPEQTYFPLPEPGEFYTVTGVSPRDSRIHHIVIYQDGEMVWDPHPDRTGLAEVDTDHHWTLRPITTEDGDQS